MIGGLAVLGLLLAGVCWVAALVSQPPRWRCHVCAEKFRSFRALLRHDSVHAPRRCLCSAGVHHPSCVGRA